VEPGTIRLTFASIEFKKKIVGCLLFFLLTTTAGATEYIVSPAPSDQAGVSINGEEVVLLRDFTVYWQFLLWLAVMNALSAADVLIFPTKLIFAILGFRITKHADIFDNSNRARIYKYIITRPGAYLSEIVEKSGIDKGAVSYHIQILKTHHKIEAYRDSGKTRYFQNNSTYGEEEKKVVSALQNSTNQRIILEILKGKCSTNAALSTEIGISRGTVSWYMKQLKELDLIEENKIGRSKIYSINPVYQDTIEKTYMKFFE